MKNLSIIFILFIIGNLLATSRTTELRIEAVTTTYPTDSLAINIFANISRKDFEKTIGRKLNLFERIAFKRTQKKFKKEPGWVLNDRKIPASAIASPIVAGAGFFSFFGNIIYTYGYDEPEDFGNGYLFWFWFGLLALLAGAILGINAIGKIVNNKGEMKGAGCAVVGIVIVALFIVLFLHLLL